MKRNDIDDIDVRIFFQNYENLFNVYEMEDKNYFYNINKKVNIPERLSASVYDEYIVQPGDTWTLLAHQLYGSVKLWWIICICNGDQNPVLLPKPGITLRILSPDTVKYILSKIRSAE